MDRRNVLVGSAKMAGALLLTGCGKVSDGAANGLASGHAGLHMPLEGEPHERTLMQWPVSLEFYDRRSLVRVQAAIARIANAISRHEPVAMLVDRKHAMAARGQLGPDVEIWALQPTTCGAGIPARHSSDRPMGHWQSR